MQHDAHVLDYIEALMDGFDEAEAKRAEAEGLNASVPGYDLP